MKKLLTLLSLATLLACSGGSSSSPSSSPGTGPGPTNPPSAPTSFGKFRSPKADVATSMVAGNMAFQSATGSTTMLTARKMHKGTLLQNGKVFLLGGEFASGNVWSPTSSAEIFDPKTERFTASAATFTLKYIYDHTSNSFDMVGMPNGKVFIAGGMNNYSATNMITIYDDLTDSATNYATLPDPVQSVEHVFYLDGYKVLITGLKTPTGTSFYDYALIYDVNHHTTQKIAMPYNYMDSAAYDDGQVIYFFGGSTPFIGTVGRDSYADVVKFDKSSLIFTKIGSLNQPKHGMGIVKLSRNRVGIYGGFSWHGISIASDPIRFKEVEVFDLSTLTTTVKSSLVSAVGWLSSVPLQGTDYTLHAGGVDDVGYTSKNEYVHNADLNLSGSTGTLIESRRFHSVTSLNNGLVLIAGGEDQTGVTKKTVEIYDPESKLFVTFITDQINAGDVVNFSCTKDVTWTLEPEDPSVKKFGSISSTGVYTSDATNTETIIVKCIATLKSDPTITASVRIKVFGYVPAS